MLSFQGPARPSPILGDDLRCGLGRSHRVALRRTKISTDSACASHLDQATKRKATAALKAMGLSPSDAIRMLMVRVARDKVLPFAPNATTIAAIEEARRGKLKPAASVDELIADMHADD